MQRKFLEGLGLEKEVIDRIMDENGKDIENAKSKLETERDNYKSQFETAQNALKEFEGVDVKDLQGKITQLNSDLAQKEADYNAKIADMEFNGKLDGIISQSGAKNAKAVRALLDIETLKASKNQDADLQAAIDTCKAENDFLFESKEPIKHPVGPTNGNMPTGLTKEAFSKMGYMERLKLKQENPEQYNEMRG